MKGSRQSFGFRPSTRAFIHEARRTRGYRLFDFIHGYFYARWPYLYIGIGTGEHRLSKAIAFIGSGLARLKRAAAMGSDPAIELEGQSGLQTDNLNFANTYHGKVVPLEAAKQLVLVREEVRLENLETIIPYTKARDIVLKNPDHIIALECPCRSARQNPCLPLDVCLIVGEPFASFAAEHHPRRTRWITPTEAVEILQAEDQRGHVHHAFFKDAMFGRFYAICNCCECCCGAMQAQRSGTPMLASSGYVCQVDEDLCLGCGDCYPACQFGALALGIGGAQLDAEKCMGCGVCIYRCEQGALALVREHSKGEPLAIVELLGQAVNEGTLNNHGTMSAHSG